MFLLNLPVDVKEQAAIERRRREEKERLSRIFNDKYRTIGIDTTSLEEQVQERQRIKELEKQRNDAFDRQMICNDLKVFLLDEDETDRQRHYAQQINAYRRAHQTPETAREWDLNDRHRWKQLTPARVADDDPRLGPSSGQIFAGEDLQVAARKKAQQEQLKHYFDLQTTAKVKIHEQERLADLVYGCQQVDLCERSDMLEYLEEECRQAMNIATRDYNEILAREAKMRASEQKARQTEEQLAEIAHTCFSDMLTESTEPDHHRIAIDRWKGMSREQLDRIRHEQLRQIAERERNEANERRLDEVWGTYANAVAKQGSLIEQQIVDDTRAVNHRVANENKRLAQAQREQQDYLNSDVYRSAPTAAFYEQFNTTSR